MSNTSGFKEVIQSANETEAQVQEPYLSPSLIVVLITGLAILILNVCCLVVLSKEKKLTKKRFYKLTICLSVSDAAIGLISSVLSFQTIYYISTGNGLAPFCFLFTPLITTTILFSLLQTLLICLDRLIATFPAVRNPCQNVSVVLATAVLFSFCATFVFPMYVVLGNVWAPACSVHYILRKNRLTVLSIIQPTMLAIISVIVIIYIIIILRVFLSWKRVHPHWSEIQRQQMQNSSSNQISRETSFSRQAVTDETTSSHSCNRTTVQNPERHNPNRNGQSESKRIWKKSVTLGMLVLIMLLSVLPKAALGLAEVYDPFNIKIQQAVNTADLFLFLNPLLDPVVYVLRIPSFRERLKCK
ncbi:unnamed protein product [Mytilus coruscus]|uniref:G-protein coupled receptors family 1 profile domain-containing protein n=1 Tax=Mytilus coruscus TaxID=42192 RepID=A0A6J8CIY0_MYTCO|nr:unnamed protein product [Mytilus coruscus]